MFFFILKREQCDGVYQIQIRLSVCVCVCARAGVDGSQNGRYGEELKTLLRSRVAYRDTMLRKSMGKTHRAYLFTKIRCGFSLTREEIDLEKWHFKSDFNDDACHMFGIICFFGGFCLFSPSLFIHLCRFIL